MICTCFWYLAHRTKRDQFHTMLDIIERLFLYYYRFQGLFFLVCFREFETYIDLAIPQPTFRLRNQPFSGALRDILMTVFTSPSPSSLILLPSLSLLLIEKEEIDVIDERHSHIEE